MQFFKFDSPRKIRQDVHAQEALLVASTFTWSELSKPEITNLK
jgi:hypothetical protein